MKCLDLLLGRSLASSEDKKERVGAVPGVSVFGLDAFSSAAYGPEAALTVLIPLGVAGVSFALPITIGISVILFLVYLSYRQTIAAYPNGAGSYTVAKENLGDKAGLLAAVALMIDYTLNVAVGISAGVNQIVSAAPALQPHTLLLCLAILAALAYVNLRGLRETGLAFLPPTYLFVGCLGVLIALGIFRAITAAGHPQPAMAPAASPAVHEQISLWLFLKAFAAGCTAMTGVEAVSNGVQAFKEPPVAFARKALTMIVSVLILLLLGVAFLVQTYKITATEPGSPQYQSILSMVTQAVVGRGIFYYITMGAVLLVLCLSANTSFADFPRVCRTIAQDGYLPYSFMVRGRRLVFTEGILVLTALAGVLLICFNGVTDKLIPLFAVGAFLAFTLSQAGMVMHWRKKRKSGAVGSVAMNGIGGAATGITFLIVIVTKFTDGAWIVFLVIPALYLFMLRIHRHYKMVGDQLALSGSVELTPPRQMIAVVPLVSMGSLAQRALQIAFGLSGDIKVVHVEQENSPPDFQNQWAHDVLPAVSRAHLAEPQLVTLASPYRQVVTPILSYIWRLEKENPDQTIAVLIPQLIESRWYYSFLHNRHATILRTLLLMKGLNRIVVVNVPWHIQEREKIAQQAHELWKRRSKIEGPAQFIRREPAERKDERA
ncbi:MAG: APC family permease [Verrucomicrobia bacterium]|nr:APC family permease [Verrucomicrobiota bacterium]